jgi:hypothetical protein
MGLYRDARLFVRAVRGGFRARRDKAVVVRQLLEVPELEPRTYQIAVYFADNAVNLYQVRQWYAPLRALQERWPVVIFARNAGTTRKLLEEAGIPVAFVRRTDELERTLADQDIRIVLYVNQNTQNFQMMRYGHVWHVFVNHGESDKAYMTTNQLKTYDYCLIAGDQARARLGRALWDVDFDKRMIPIGRPQADYFGEDAPFPRDDRTVVLYGPTWEGDRAWAKYGSISSHGVALVEALVTTGRHRVVYRPHPRSGVSDADYRATHLAIVERLERANHEDPTAQHVYDTSSELGWQLRVPDVAILDISAMIYDRLSVGKPLLVTRPVNPHVAIDEEGYLSDADWLTADEARDIVARLDTMLGDARAAEKLAVWSQRYFGDTTPGVATARFEGAIERLMGEWDKWDAISEQAAIEASGLTALEG